MLPTVLLRIIIKFASSYSDKDCPGLPTLAAHLLLNLARMLLRVFATDGICGGCCVSKMFQEDSYEGALCVFPEPIL